jgi:hypothetical protein
MSCLLLNLVGVDEGRWAAISTWALLIAILVSEYRRSDEIHEANLPRQFIGCGLILSLPVGPIGVVPAFSYIVRMKEMIMA